MAVKTNDDLFLGCKGLLELLIKLASEKGDAIDSQDLKKFQLSGAMTNKVYKVSWPSKSGDERIVLVRIYGEGVDLFFDRDQEISTFQSLSGLGYAPKLLGQVEEGRVEEFIHAKTLSAADLRDPETASLIASKMKEFHRLEMPTPKEPNLWKRLRSWLVEAKTLCTSEDAKEFKLNTLEEEITSLEEAISKEGQEIGFCHNDLQYGNIMIDDNKTITIIDYEYASYNPVAYDVANHFCEMAANYHSVTPHTLDYTKYPGLEERRRFIQNYLSSSGNEPNEAVDQLVEDVEKYTLANHIFWGLWGLISARVNNIEFDFKEYARQRFDQYWLRKAAILKTRGGGGGGGGGGGESVMMYWKS